MELDELKKNWNIMEERLEQIEMENFQLKTKSIDDKVKQMRNRLLLRMTPIVFLLPLCFLHLVNYAEIHVRLLTWVLMIVFVFVIAFRQFAWMWLLKKIDCMCMTVSEVYLAENRFRVAFKMGIALSVLFTIPLLTSLIWDIAGSGNQYVLIGACSGVVVGVLLGARLFIRAWKGVKELREAVADLK